LTIIGTFGAVPGGTQIGWNPGSVTIGIPAGQTALLADLRFAPNVTITNSPGAVILDRVETQAALSISLCADVRLHRHTAAIATTITNAHFEIESSSLNGQSGGFIGGYGGDGQTALSVGWSCRGLIARSSCAGGHGGSVPIGLPGDGGKGAPGINLNSTSTLLIAGGGVGTVAGGWGGVSYFQFDGDDGDGLSNFQCGVWRSGCVFTCGQTSGNAVPISYVAGPGSFDTPIVPDDPTLELSGTPTPGGSVQLNVHANPGAVVRLALGRTPIVVPTAGVRVDKLVAPDSVLFLGVVPPSGVISQAISFRVGYTPGTTFHAQAFMSDSAVGETRRTNSVALIVR
jgi:hypothetical protein